MLLFLSFLFFFVSLYPCTSRAGDAPLDITIVSYPDSIESTMNIVVHEHAQIFLHDPQNGYARPIYTAFCDQMLQGYRFFPEIDVKQGGPKLLHPEVRDHICKKVPFFSETMAYYFAELASFVVKTGSLRMSERRLNEHFYPYGKTRQWSLVPKNSVRPSLFENRVFICFSQEHVALKGVLRDRARGAKNAEGQSLLDFKRLWENKPCGITLECMMLPTNVRKNAFCMELEHCPSKCGVGVVFCSPSGIQKRALFDLSGCEVPAWTADKKVAILTNMPQFSYLRTRLFDGFFLKRSVKCLANVELFYDPEVREAVCDRVCFCSPSHVCDVLELFDGVPRLKYFAVDSNALQKEDIRQWLGHGSTLQWTPVNRNAFVSCSDEDTPKNCIFVLLQNESVILRGDIVPMPKYPYGVPYLMAESLKALWSRGLFFYAGHVALKQGVRVSVGVKDLRFVKSAEQLETFYDKSVTAVQVLHNKIKFRF